MTDLDLGRGGALGTVAALLGDLLLNSGEFVAVGVAWIAGNADLLLPLFSTLRSQIAPRVEWLPADLLDTAVFAVAVLFLLVLLYRLGKRTVGE